MQPVRTTVEHLSASSDEWFDIANSVEVVLDLRDQIQKQVEASMNITNRISALSGRAGRTG